jgi:hypothetical protein
MPVKPLPPDANLDHLKQQAGDLLKSHAARDPQVAQRIREFHPRFQRATDAAIFDARLSLDDAQLAIACGRCHSTPLHQAVAGGHGETVRLLVERGARLDAKDTLWQGTPAGWAKHEGRTDIEEYLRARQVQEEARGEKSE